MTNYVALVRGVAPSTPPRNNACILAALEKLDFLGRGLAPVLSSGNYVFSAATADTDELEAQIEAAFVQELGVELLTMVRSQQQIQRLLDESPLAGVEHGKSSYQLVTFFKHPVDIGLELPNQPEGKAFQLAGCVDGTLYSLTDNTIGSTVNVMAWLEKRFTTELTSRTPGTLQKILNKMDKALDGIN
ncbi:MAG: DUF1697 domain-containing protein [Coriobacteriales bacterium]|nr:DUF1697 domain-containing protein [Coriobacteriales bacterium]